MIVVASPPPLAHTARPLAPFPIARRRKQYVGAAKSAAFANAGKYLVVATDANAVAALNARSGELVQ